MAIDQPDLQMGPEQLRAVEFAAHACGRLAAAVETAGGALADVLLIRHAVRVYDGDADLAAELMLARESMIVPDTSATAATSVDKNRSSILEACVEAGTIVAANPSSADTQRDAALAGALALVRGGSLPEPWVAPWQLDAAARSAAVQIDRSRSWGEWIRVWCHLLAREAGATEHALREAARHLSVERADARAQHRVGTTDAAVLEWLQSHLTFTIRDASAPLGLTKPTVGTAIERLESIGFATELTGRRRDRVWASSTLLIFAGSH